MIGNVNRLGAWRWVAGIVVLGGVISVGCKDRQEEAVGGLSESGFGFSVRDYLRAAGEGRLEVVEMFLAAGMAVDVASAPGETALMRAVDNRHLDLVHFLLAKGAEADVAGAMGETVILKAARSGDTELVGAVLERGADPTVKNDDGWSPLTVAAFDGHTDVVKMLAPKCRVYLDDALHLAAVSGSTEVADVLLNNGASVFARSKDGQTALMYASENGHLEVVKLLLRNGANRFALDEDDQTASDLASSIGYAGVADYLQEPLLAEEAEIGEPEFVGWDDPAVEFVVVGEAVEEFVGEDGVVGSAGGGEPVYRAGGVVSEQLGGVPDGGSPASVGAGAGAAGSTGGSAAVAGALRRRAVAPRLDGAVIPLDPEGSPVQLDQEARLESYRETQLPVILAGVDEGSAGVVATADVRILYGGHPGPVKVEVGEVVPDTDLEILEVRRRFVYSKQGKGEAVDVSEMVLHDRRTGVHHLVRKDFPAGASESYAVMRLAGGGVYDVRTQDEFEVAGQPSTRFRVVDVRPTQIVIEDTTSGEAITVQRFGTAAR